MLLMALQGAVAAASTTIHHLGARVGRGFSGALLMGKERMQVEDSLNFPSKTIINRESPKNYTGLA